MMKKDMVSAIVTTYKRDPEMLMQSVDSIMKQTYRNMEIIVIDDNGLGSDFQKKNEEIFRKYPQIRYIPNAVNSGAQFSRNHGILESEGEYVAFLDDDDLWAETKIEKQIKLFTSPEVGMVFCDAYRFYDDNLKELYPYQQAAKYGEPISFSELLYTDYIGSTSKSLIRKECLARTGMFDLDMPARQDYEMWLRISKSYQCIGVDEPLLYYRCHRGERISTNYEKCRNSYRLLLKKYKSDYRRAPKAKAKVYHRIAKAAFRANKYAAFVRYYVTAFFFDPAGTVKDFLRVLKKDQLYVK